MREEERYMKQAIRLAKKGGGWVNPNPAVGAVIVKDARIIGKGFHEYFGGSHAEVNAIGSASAPVAGATLYVTLEPCIHQGKTGPCTPFIISQGIRKVVIGMKDPNPQVNGKGIRLLQEAGIEVVSGILEPEVRQMNESFIKFITTGMPFCTLKTAMTLDGKIATVNNASRWISGEESRNVVHELRHNNGAILVGANTIIYDNPLLNTRRKAKKGKDPLKVIADTKGRIPTDARVLQHEPQLVVLATTKLAKSQKMKELERKGVHVLICPEKEGRIDLRYLFHSLGIMGIDSILLEGGSTLAFSAIREGLVDKVISFIAPKILGGKSAPTPVGGEGFAEMDDAVQLHDIRIKKLGEDIMVEGYIGSMSQQVNGST